ncbi:hypothetical protein H9K76_06870 [Diaphorobacter ruginosibacter]|uniref:Integral membrane protein n=1 Tax=Diaphorobacter ruginosibacter TaxID=1715720 RepID=A0A7G9RSI0_9BURK|nr:hypothetical protein [Diaphorobacter ruginosibacter]QNN58555.1 hypothetical protein H9K76_06870 [Diaphorobacter ruginosibacter]
MSNIANHPGLKTILRLDAVTCAAVAALQLALPGQLHAWLGIAPALLIGSAVFLLAYVALLLVMARAGSLWNWLLQCVVIGNVGWGIGCLVLALALPGTTALGKGYLAVQALCVFVIAAWQWRAGLQGRPSFPAARHA